MEPFFNIYSDSNYVRLGVQNPTEHLLESHLYKLHLSCQCDRGVVNQSSTILIERMVGPMTVARRSLSRLKGSCEGEGKCCALRIENTMVT